MIKIIAKLIVAENKIEDFKAAAQNLIQKSREEEGNIFYTLNVSTTDPCLMVFVECWKDEAAVASHNSAEHFTSILPQLVDMCTENPVIELYEEIL